MNLIMRCISFTSYSVLVNGCQRESFTPSRGLRQGDPLSPFLFLICGEGLSTLMKLVMRKGSIKRAKASRLGSTISHLLFADDSLLFWEASESGATILKGILNDYEGASGQMVNFVKSIVIFSTNTGEVDRSNVLRILGMRSSSNIEKYLRLPNMVGKDK